MKKTLVYHVYLNDDIETNIAYKINLECIKYYKNIFDDIKFVIVMDDLSNFKLRNKGLNWINDIGFNGNTDIIFRKNTKLGEAATVRDYVVNFNIDRESMVFFAHSKGITNFQKEDVYNESIFNWILTLYFYNLQFVEEVESLFTGKTGPMETFYGTLLMVNGETTTLPIMIPKAHYSGSFYWVNKPQLIKLMNNKNVKDYVFSTRYDAEFYPGYNFNYNSFGAGMGSHNQVALKLDNALGSFYVLNDNMWNDIISLLGDVEEFNKFKKKIKEILNI